MSGPSSTTPRNAFLFAAAVAVLVAGWFRSRTFDEPTPRAVKAELVTGGSGPFWQLVAAGARQAAAKQHVELTVRMPKDDENVAQQTELLEKTVAGQLDGVAVSPLDAQGQAPLIDKIAEHADVVTFDSDAPQSKRLRYIGTINVHAGKQAAEMVRQALPQGGKIALAIANLTKDNLVQRQAGFDDALRGFAAERALDDSVPAYEVVARIVDDGDATRCRELVAKALAEHPDLACLVGMNAQHGALLLESLQAADQLGKIAVVAFDEEEETLAGVEAGTIHATIVQDPYRYGYDAVCTLAEFARGGEGPLPLEGSYSTHGIATFPVTKATVADFRRQLAQRLGD